MSLPTRHGLRCKILGNAQFRQCSLKRAIRNVLVYGLDGFGVDIHSLESKGKKWSVDLGHGENIIFTVITTDNAKFFHVVNIDSHTSNVFPGVHVAGSQIFIQFRPISDDTTMIEFGWGGNFNGDIDVAIIQLGSFGQNLVCLDF